MPSRPSQTSRIDPEQASKTLVAAIIATRNDPLNFVYYVFPWGKPGTPLAGETGPDDWQITVLLRIGQLLKEGASTTEALGAALRLAVASGHGIGKGWEINALVDTPNGVRRWGDLQVGDFLFGRDGTATKITAVYPQPRQMLYRVTFDDRSVAVVDGPHLWSVRGRQERRNGLATWRTMSTQEIIAAGVQRPNGAALARQWEIPRVDPVQYRSRAVPMEPYRLGLWLGNGSGPVIIVNALDDDVVRAGGLPEGVMEKGCRRHRIGIAAVRAAGLEGLRSWEKYVPDLYKYNDVETRSAVLRGLMDTDGEVNQAGTAIFSSTSQRLAEDVMWLARSLGGKAQMQPTTKRGRYRDDDGKIVECRDCYRVTVTMPRGFRLFESARKGDRLRADVEDRYLSRWIESIEPVGEGESMCVTVDAPDSLYVANDFIVTHNTALVAWLILWFISTRENPQIVVTANTKAQLDTKTWRELAKWHKLMINDSWFTWTATRFYHVENPETWFAAAIPWSKSNPQAFAGTHEQHVLVIYDEASGIDDQIWEVTEGAMTTPGAMWFVFGNPERNDGRFADCFGRFSNRWNCLKVDSRRAKKANPKQIEQWIEDYGEDSDFVRVRVKGEFPRHSTDQFIGRESVDRAIARTIPPDEVLENEPLIIGVDVARFGDDQTVFLWRRGPVVTRIVKFRQMDLHAFALKTIEYIKASQPHAVFIDGGGLGAGPIDTIRHYGFEVEEVRGDFKAAHERDYFNKRTEMWGEMRTWIDRVACLPRGEHYDEDLVRQLTAPLYSYDKSNRVQLESKRDMKARNLASPDTADALAHTFFLPVQAPQIVSSVQRELNRLGRLQGRGRVSWMAR